jgi:hypothetical protein
MSESPLCGLGDRVYHASTFRFLNLRGVVPLLIIALGIPCGLAQARAQQVSASPSVSSTVTPPPRGGSASFFKSSTDSGILYDWSSYENEPSGCLQNACGSGWDACTYSQAIGSFNQDLQQYTVPGCVPAQTPWISTNPSTTGGWAIYCPSSAPYQWRTIEAQGQTYQFWTDTSGWMKNLAPVPGQNSSGPNPPAKADWSMHNWSAIHSHHWGYIVGCSTISDGSSAVYSQPPYSHGQGTSACPHNWPIPQNVCGPGVGVGGPRTRMLKGPAYRVTRTGPRSYGVTREVDLRRGRVATYSLSCRRGYRRVSQHWAVGSYTTTPPSRRQGQTQERVISERARSLTLSVRTNAHVRPGTARLQIALDCRR